VDGPAWCLAKFMVLLQVGSPGKFSTMERKGQKQPVVEPSGGQFIDFVITSSSTLLNVFKI
jgi:hypothetical protein